MTGREIVERTLRGEAVERPATSILSGINWILKRDAISAEELVREPDGGARRIWDAAEAIGSDIVFGGRALSYIGLRAMGGVIENSKKGESTQLVKSPIAAPGDIARIDMDESISRLLADDDFAQTLTEIRELRRLAGNDKAVAVGGFGPFSLASQMVGVQNLMFAIADEDEDLKKLFDFTVEFCIRFTKLMYDAGGTMVYTAEPVASGDLISPDMFAEWALPLIARMQNALTEFCPYSLFHICGNTMARLEPLASTSLSAFSVDSIDMEQAMKLVDGRYALMGNLNPVSVLYNETPAAIRRLSRALCETGGCAGHFILGPGCDLAPGTPLENLQAMTSVALNF